MEFGHRPDRRALGRRALGRRARWAVPAAAIIAVGGVVTGTAVAAGAQAAPSLPARSAAELLADMQRATGPGALTGTVQESASLGLPALPDSGDPSSALSLLSGSHTVTVWYADPAHVRVAEPVQLGETDLRVDGRQVWLWDSKTQTATHVVLPSPPSGRSQARPPAGPAAGPPPTPQQAARQILAAVGPTTTVSVQRNVTVAGQAAYQLALAPKDSRSLVGQVLIAVDATRYLPLRVEVFARGATSPALQVGFTALSFGRPAASNFAFAPPPGAKVKTIKVPAVGPSAAAAKVAAGVTSSVRVSAPAGQHGVTLRPVPRGSLYSVAGWSAGSPLAGTTYLPDTPADGSAGPTVMGQGWLSVVVLPGGLGGSPAVKVTRVPAINGNAGNAGTNTATSTFVVSPVGGLPVAGPDSAMLRALQRAATPVHGAWGSGRLLRTSLISVLITAKGPVLAGAVAPSVLYADAAALK